MTNQPNTGGVASVLQTIAMMELFAGLIGGALADLSFGYEVALMTCACVTSALLWAAAAVVQELRKIEFNTRAKQVEQNISSQPSISEAIAEAGLRADPGNA